MHTDVTTSYLGLQLRSPLVVGACPLMLNPETVREVAIAGAGAVVLPSLLEEQVVRQMVERGDEPSRDESRVEASSAGTRDDRYNGGVESYLQTITQLKRHTGIPVIANLNGCTAGNWLTFAQQMEAAGADAIELSLHTDTTDPSFGPDAVEAAVLNAVEAVCDTVTVPVAVKLLPFFTSLPNFAWRLAEVGAAGVVLFGREPVWDLSDGILHPTSHWSLSDAGQLQTTLSGLIRLRTGGPEFSVAASGGITTTQGVMHAIAAGANVAMVTSELYRTGPDVIAHLLEGIVHYLRRVELSSFDQLVTHTKQLNQSVPSRREQSRRNQIEPMTRLETLRDPSPEPATQVGDRWGHPHS